MINSNVKFMKQQIQFITMIMVTLEAADIKFEDVLKELENRKKQSGIEEKNNR